MTQKEFEKLDKQERKKYNNLLLIIQKKLIEEIKKIYNKQVLEIKPKYDNNGNLINQKEVKNNINSLQKTINKNWENTYDNLEKYKEKQSQESYSYFEKVHHYFWLIFITKNEWNKKIKKLEEIRKINIKKILIGKSNNQTKKLNSQVNEAIKKQATAKEIKKIITTNFYNMGEETAKRILLNEMNTYKEMFDLVGTDDMTIEKKWRYTYRSKVERSWHKRMNNQIADDKGYFKSPLGNKTKAPRLFGKASEDCSCKCEMEIGYLEDIKYLDRQLTYYSKFTSVGAEAYFSLAREVIKNTQ